MQTSTQSKPRGLVDQVFVTCFLFLISAYQLVVSPLKLFLTGSRSSCRFAPTCSEYARLSFLRHGLIKGLYLTLRRLLKCHPFNDGGYDPPPGTDSI